MKKLDYASPQTEILKLELESVVLADSLNVEIEKGDQSDISDIFGK